MVDVGGELELQENYTRRVAVMLLSSFMHLAVLQFEALSSVSLIGPGCSPCWYNT